MYFSPPVIMTPDWTHLSESFRGIFINKGHNQTLRTSQLWHVFALCLAYFLFLELLEIIPFEMRDHENIIVEEWCGVGRGICSPNTRGEYFHSNNLNMILEECFQLKELHE